jgi:hypothetical protein
MMKRMVAAVVLGVFMGSANAALIGRAPETPGGAGYVAYYDDILEMTGSLPRTVEPDGLEWAAALSLGGIDNWSLAGVDELRHMGNINNIR